MAAPPLQTFQKGDRIFAKMRGYPAWPARIESQTSASPNPKNARYNVFFYGTYQTAICKAEDLCDFVEKKEKLGLPKKQRGFNEAMWEIEHKPDVEPPVIVDVDPSSPEPDEDTDVEKTPAKKTPAKKAAPKRARSSIKQEGNPDNTERPKKKKYIKSVYHGEEMPFGVLSDDEGDSTTPKKNIKTTTRNKSPVSARTTQRRTPVKDVTTDDDDSPTKTENRVKPKVPVIALRSPVKKTNEEPDEDEAETPSPEYSDIELEESGAQDVKKPKVELKECKLQEDEDNGNADHIRVTLTRKQVLDLLSMEDVPDSLRDKLTKHLVAKFESKAVHQTQEEKAKFLDLEDQILQAEKLFPLYLGVEEPVMTKKAIALLKQIQLLKLNSLMLLKHPFFVGILVKLTHYTGCVAMWELSPAEEETFISDASKIREIAREVIDHCKTLLKVPKDCRFLSWYQKEALLLRRLVPLELFKTMTQAPSVLDFFHSHDDDGTGDEDDEMSASAHGDFASGQSAEEETDEELLPARLPLQPIALNSMPAQN